MERDAAKGEEGYVPKGNVTWIRDKISRVKGIGQTNQVAMRSKPSGKAPRKIKVGRLQLLHWQWLCTGIASQYLTTLRIKGLKQQRR